MKAFILNYDITNNNPIGTKCTLRWGNDMVIVLHNLTMLDGSDLLAFNNFLNI